MSFLEIQKLKQKSVTAVAEKSEKMVFTAPALKPLDMVNIEETKDYLALKKQIEEANSLEKSHINSLLVNMFKHRDRFSSMFSGQSALLFFITPFFLSCCPCLFRNRKKVNSSEFKKAKTFENGIKRYYEELDIVKLLRAIRLNKILFWTKLKPR